jgi:hypothetical protein
MYLHPAPFDQIITAVYDSRVILCVLVRRDHDVTS